MKRRMFFGSCLSGILGFGLSNAKAKTITTPVYLLNPVTIDGLEHIHAEHICPAKVFLFGQEIDQVTDIIGSPKPGITVMGYARVLLTDEAGNWIHENNGFKKKWLVGKICWEPLEGSPRFPKSELKIINHKS